MKFSCEGTRIILEIEQSDCEPGYTPELTASAMLEGILIGQRHKGEVSPPFIYPSLMRELLKAKADFEERWEIVNEPEPHPRDIS